MNRTEQNAPQVAPYSTEDRANLHTLAEGKAVMVEPDETWLVEDSDGVTTREFDTEENARAFWHENGGALVRRVETSWVVSGDWAERVEWNR